MSPLICHICWCLPRRPRSEWCPNYVRMSHPSAAPAIIIKYDPSGRFINACLKHSPYCIPPPYKGSSVRCCTKGLQCKSPGWCRRAASNHPQIGSMNWKSRNLVPLDRLNIDKSMRQLCWTILQNLFIQSRLSIITRRHDGNFLCSSDGEKCIFFTFRRAVSTTTWGKVCNFKKNFQNTSEYRSLQHDNISSHLSWIATKFLAPVTSTSSYSMQ